LLRSAASLAVVISPPAPLTFRRIEALSIAATEERGEKYQS